MNIIGFNIKTNDIKNKRFKYSKSTIKKLKKLKETNPNTEAKTLKISELKIFILSFGSFLENFKHSRDRFLSSSNANLFSVFYNSNILINEVLNDIEIHKI